MQRRLYTYLFLLCVAIIFVIFSYMRLKSVLYDAVPYTYDQGRDFYKAAEMVVNHDLTFIGPTTGIDGIFHGAWWYYYLVIPFIVFGGSPIGFFYANTFIHLLSLIFLAFILSKYFNKSIALFISALIAVSPYFVRTGIFVGNNTMVLPFLLIFLIANFFWIEKYPHDKKKQWLLAAILGGSLGFVAEFEFAFGLLILPTYMIIMAIHPILRKQILQMKNAMYFAAALVFAFTPRILFELKNNFSQTRTLLGFISEPKLFDPKPYDHIVLERLRLLTEYYVTIFPNTLTMQIVTVILCAIVIISLLKRKIKYSSSLLFYLLLVIGLYAVSTAYRDSFWINYYEGFPYIYIMIIATVLLGIRPYLQKYLLVAIVPTIILLSVGSYEMIKDLPIKSPQGRLNSISQAVNYITSEEKNDNYCVKVYTPPAIPHTYKYLFFYKEYKNIKKQPETDWVNGYCWIVLEADSYTERKEKWMTDNIPGDATIVDQKRFYDIDVQLRKRNPIVEEP